MAKKYLKNENGIVRAITSDNLQLEKPLLNENYDIEVHNRNMDKIDGAIQEVKGKIDGLELVASNVKMADGTTVEDAVSVNKTGISSLNSEIDVTNNNLMELKTKVNNGQNFKTTQDTGNSITLPAGYDINNLRSDSGKGTAHYYGTGLANCPYTGYCHVENIRLGSNGDYQKVMQISTGLKQERHYYNGWQPWREL